MQHAKYVLDNLINPCVCFALSDRPGNDFCKHSGSTRSSFATTDPTDGIKSRVYLDLG
jgi:hypothetical protein